MFTKPNSPMSSPDPIDTSLDMPSPRKGPRAASLISSDMKIEGSVSCEGELQIDGNVKGDVRVARLTIGEHGEIEGSVVAESVECRGRVIGSVQAKQVRLHAQSHVDGDITHEQLAMEAGAFFQGRSLRLQRPAAPKPAAAPGFAAPASPSANANSSGSSSSTPSV